MNKISQSKVKAIAFYLPQYHPIEENNKWWGNGFTEWTNVTKAKPLYPKHEQPKLPADLGFYDLRVSETREAQAELAKQYGIHGFCYWHYWFGNGKRLLERPFNEVLESGKPDFPFCLAWANHTWSGIWDGCPDRILIKQEYPGIEDHKKHFYEVLPAFKDSRYILVDERPVFVIFNQHEIPDIVEYMALWRELAIKEGLNGIYFVGLFPMHLQQNSNVKYFDAITSYPPGVEISLINANKKNIQKTNELVLKKLFGVYDKPSRYEYLDFIKYSLPNEKYISSFIPTVIPNWDNTPRSGINGVVLENTNPDNFSIALKNAISYISNEKHKNNIFFIKSWNEWAEGNYLEPDRKYGRKWLESIKTAIDNAL
jgi:hypothetical protein